MTERARLISYLLYGSFSAGKKKKRRKTGSVFQYSFSRARGHSRSCSLNRENPDSVIETKRDSRNSSLKMRQFLSLLRQDLGEI